MASAEFTVNASAVSGAVTVSASTTVNLALASTTGVNSVVWSVVGSSDPGLSNPTITPAGSPSGATASYPQPAGAGKSFIVQCVINGGRDSSGNIVAAWTFRAVIGTANAAAIVPLCVGETTERHATHGYTATLNQALESAGGAAAAGAWKEPVRFAYTGTLPAFTYSSGVITVDANGAFPTTDGVTPALNDAVLVADNNPEGLDGKYNGLYTITVLGDGSTQAELTRRSDLNTSAHIVRGSRVPVQEGDVYSGGVFALTSSGTTLDTDVITFQSLVVVDTLDVRGAITTDGGDTSMPAVVDFDLNSGASPVTVATINTAADGDDVVYEVTAFANLRQDGGGAGDFVQKVARAFERDGGTLAARTALRSLENAADDTDGTGFDIAVSTDDIVISIDPDSTNSYNGPVYYSVAKRVVT